MDKGKTNGTQKGRGNTQRRKETGGEVMTMTENRLIIRGESLLPKPESFSDMTDM